MKKYTVIDLGMGWYSFKNLPQDNSYIKIHAVCCGNNEKAIRQTMAIAKKNNLKGEFCIVKENSRLEWDNFIIS